MSSVADVRRKWAEALRSGGYKQGAMVLRRGDNFCVMGVLCDVTDPGGWRRDDRTWLHRGYMFSVPDSVRAAAALTSEDVDALTTANDRGTTFDELAGEVERLPVRV